ncbi:solute carrier organic anion transporter family member 2A1 isoform X1 [Neodiprion pinetum]|uniref:solute carrier organic anion transporter family member 2A1 isoform X1 n=1 Tax=Neodiprion pinetum TaxID=441929 RepID=UPI001EDE4F8F|nr:solute carrier organic anion transporter family member 2A1-like isoform X1 [Neodiprion pinetum]
MAIGPQRVVRSELEGGLSGPANPIPDESIDCGCGQMSCPKLARFATRSLFVGLVSTIGTVQAAAQAYFLITSHTIARKFQFDPTIIEWVVVLSCLTPVFVGLLVAYWGDRIHRAAWTGGWVMVQGVAYISLIIPHLASSDEVEAESTNVTHMSLYSDDSPELCSPETASLTMDSTDTGYVILGLLIVVQIISGIASVAYYALALSYIDDNTKKKNVAIYIGVVLSVTCFGVLLGCLLAWLCLMIDSESLSRVDTYQEQIGAWWLGWPILGVLLIIPAFFVAIFPRRLPSEVVEQAAASILDSANGSRRSSFKSYNQALASTGFFRSVLRMFENKIIIFNALAASFAITALVNFMANESIFLESRYYIPRPTGMYLGFGDPWTSRLVAHITRPIIAGSLVIIAGLIIAKFRPAASYVAGYTVIAMALTATIFLALAFATCDKPSIVGTYRDTLILLKYCNKNCRCSRDADFRPVCDEQGRFTFYSPCHAGCTTVEFVNNTKYYSDCSCVEEMLGLGNIDAVDGPCGSTSCHIGWIIYQVSSVLITALLATAAVGNVIIVFRAIYPQDKALTVGFHMAHIAMLAYMPGKMLYERIVARTCKLWGTDEIVCRLYDTDKLADYICYLSAAIAAIGAIFQFLVWYFSRNLKLYGYPEIDLPEDTELQGVQTSPLLGGVVEPLPAKSVDTVDENPDDNPGNVDTAVTPTVHSVTAVPQERVNQPSVTEEAKQTSTPLKFGPLGPGNIRTKSTEPAVTEARTAAETEDELDSSTDDETHTVGRKRSTEIAYRPLELDSDVEIDLSSAGPRTRRNVISRDFDPVLNNIGIASFPTQDSPKPAIESDEEDGVYRERRKSRPSRSMQNVSSLSPVQERVREFESRSDNDDGFSKTDSFEYSAKAPQRPKKITPELAARREPYRLTGDFNEVGIPILDLDKEPTTPLSPGFQIQSIQASQDNFQGHLSRENLDKIPVYDPSKELGSPESPIKSEQYKLEDVVAEPEVPPLPTSPPPQSSGSSGFGSLPLSDVEENKASARSRENLGSDSPSTSPGGTKLLTLITDF